LDQETKTKSFAKEPCRCEPLNEKRKNGARKGKRKGKTIKSGYHDQLQKSVENTPKELQDTTEGKGEPVWADAGAKGAGRAALHFTIKGGSRPGTPGFG